MRTAFGDENSDGEGVVDAAGHLVEHVPLLRATIVHDVKQRSEHRGELSGCHNGEPPMGK